MNCDGLAVELSINFLVLVMLDLDPGISVLFALDFAVYVPWDRLVPMTVALNSFE